jgi:hypothetical protein
MRIAPQTRSESDETLGSRLPIYIGLAKATLSRFAHSLTPTGSTSTPVRLQGNRVREQNGTVFPSRWGDHMRKARFHVIIEA